MSELIITADLYWQRITPGCFEEYKSNKNFLLLYSPEPCEFNYEIIYWDNYWMNLGGSESDLWNSYTDKELYNSSYTHFCVLKKPKESHE